MSKNRKRNVSVTGSIEFSNLQLKEPSKSAAGLTGVKVAIQHAFNEMGIGRSLKTLSKLNQVEGIDCPGCAWPDPEKRSKLGEFCENGVKAIAEEATTKKIDASFFKNYSVEELSQWTDYEIGKSGRLTEPMVLYPNEVHYKPISWHDAFTLITDELKQLDNPNEAIFYTSGRSSNEAAFLYGLFVRAFGTNNLPDCSNMCHESSGIALSETLGIGKGSVKLKDFEQAEVVMILGQNPGTNHPRMLNSLEKCKRNDGKIIAINPLKEVGLINFKNPQKISGYSSPGVALADIYLQVKINQDVALLKLILKKLKDREEQKEGVFDWDFIETYTSGVENLLEDLDKYDVTYLLELCGVEEKLIDKTVDLLASKSKIIICWAMGLTQHKNAVDNIKECVNLLLLKGSLGKPGSGTCPVRGHSNVQGDRSVGIMHYVSKDLNDAIKKEFNFEAPKKQGLDVVESIEAMHNNKAKIFVALGGNFSSAASDSYYTAEALEKCSLTVQISTKLNRSHLITGKTALILPTLGRTEIDERSGNQRFLTVENSMGKVHTTRGTLKPTSGNLKSEPEIIGGIANSFFGGNHNVNWKTLSENYDLIREKIENVCKAYKGVTHKAQKNGFYLPNNVRDLDFSKLPDGKAQFSLCQLSDIKTNDDEFVLMTIRSHDQFNTTIYGMNDRYRGVLGERRIVMMNIEDMNRLDLKNKDVINLASYYDNKERKIENFKVIPYDIPKGNLAAYFPETNPLVPINQYARKSQTPISKSIKVKVYKTLIL
ncbi:FdhF/YdeP family oxidoreductase [Winogradskyella sp.]|uniref:FdhF/YdeP family oxidoreductase n=1 Tax=Winogradskyella sp. TaxID=1883156 RepID=UPI0025D5EE01|nr:FdhF/YdeP family oxidoreductase [Winogradskyella sp.]